MLTLSILIPLLASLGLFVWSDVTKEKARLVALGPFVSMKELVSATCHANDFSLDFVKVPVPHSQTLEFLAGKEEGKFLLVSERGTHALAVDAGRGLILESDPAFPHAVPLTLEGFAALGVKVSMDEIDAVLKDKFNARFRLSNVAQSP